MKSTETGVQSRVSRFLDLLITDIIGATKLPHLKRDLENIRYLDTHKPGFPIDPSQLPCFTLSWHGISQASGYQSFRFDEGRLEITYSYKRTDDIRSSERYLEAVREEVSRVLFKRKQRLGIHDCSALVGIPGSSAASRNVVQIQDQYEIKLV